MQLHEIKKATGLEYAEIVTGLGLEGVDLNKSPWLTKVEDGVGKAFIEANGGEVEPETPETARFWSPYRSVELPSNLEDERGDIKFEDWIVELPHKSVEAAFMRKDDIRDRMFVREVVQAPYDSPGKRADFIRYLESLIYTGPTRSAGPSREGMHCVRSMLNSDQMDRMSAGEKNSPRLLARAVSEIVSLNITAFGAEERQ